MDDVTLVRPVVVDQYELRDGVRAMIRQAVDGDMHFIHSTWLRSERPLRKALLDHMIRTGSFRVACSPEVQDAIYGWACYSEDRPMWVFVVHGMRGIGLGKLLAGR